MLYSKRLSNFSNFVHGFSQRQDGDFRQFKDVDNLLIKNSTLLQNFDINNNNLILANQIHQDKCASVGQNNTGKMIKDTDGLITTDTDIFLGIRTADCCPILFYDSQKKIIAAIHAGWQGTSLKIVQVMINKFKKINGNIDNLQIIIGPHICGSCYDISEERSKYFPQNVILHKNKKYFLNLKKANIDQMLDSGVKQENIELISYCTFHNNDQFFSYRKNYPEDNYGELISFIGMKS